MHIKHRNIGVKRTMDIKQPIYTHWTYSTNGTQYTVYIAARIASIANNSRWLSRIHVGDVINFNVPLQHSWPEYTYTKTDDTATCRCSAIGYFTIHDSAQSILMLLTILWNVTRHKNLYDSKIQIQSNISS